MKTSQAAGLSSNIFLIHDKFIYFTWHHRSQGETTQVGHGYLDSLPYFISFFFFFTEIIKLIEMPIK